ncbi:hypothetical protein SLS58_010651 [Diplodia intermedia]|uniref:Zn(2)-C6 fungal-type domain-containing protein n=1 Tax=Diplodia intermedia TaxID=856260 RepID=A0ABR3T4K5_9PEZI
MCTRQGFSSSGHDAPSHLIDDVDSLSNEAFLQLSAAPFGGRQGTQAATSLIESYSTVDPLGVFTEDNSLIQLDWAFNSPYTFPNNGLQYEHDPGSQLHTFDHNHAATSSKSLFMPQNVQSQVDESVSDIAQSGGSDEGQFSDRQTSVPSFRLDDYVHLTPTGTPSSTPEGNRSRNGNLAITPEGTSSWYMVSPDGSLAASRSIEISEGSTPNSFVVVPSPEAETGPAGRRLARIVPKRIFPTSNNPDAQATGANGIPEILVESVTSYPVSEPMTEDWNCHVSATKRKRADRTEASRAQAKRVRKIGACVRCRMDKEKCDEGTPCKSCRHYQTTHRLFFQPCSRQEILNAILVRHGNGKFGQVRVSFRKYLWTNLESGPRTVEMCWTLPDNISRPIEGLRVPCHEFLPSAGDITAENWQVGGKVTTVDLPRFACADEDALGSIVDAMVERNRAGVEQRMAQSITDPLARATFDEAYRAAPKNAMVRLALRIRSTAAFCQGWGSITGAETLGTPEVDNAERGYCGRRPISPALCHQLDVVFLKMMERDERALVGELKKAVFQKNPKPWYDIFLAYFVIMWHLKYIHGQAVGFMKSQEQTRTETNVRFVVSSMVDEWENSAGNMLYHFRYVLRAFLPFQKAREDMASVRKQGNLDEHAVSYLRRAVSLLDERSKDISILVLKSNAKYIYNRLADREIQQHIQGNERRCGRQMDSTTV